MENEREGRDDTFLFFSLSLFSFVETELTLIYIVLSK